VYSSSHRLLLVDLRRTTCSKLILQHACSEFQLSPAILFNPRSLWSCVQYLEKRPFDSSPVERSAASYFSFIFAVDDEFSHTLIILPSMNLSLHLFCRR
jgi:hypothetical protein